MAALIFAALAASIAAAPPESAAGATASGASASALMGYRIDNSANLLRGMPGTLPAFALGLSN